MNLDEFVHNLHFDIERANQPNWEADWDDAPLPYKLYRDLPRTPLSSEVPLTLASTQQPMKPDLETIGHFLWYAAGTALLSESSIEGSDDSMLSSKRFAPAGGALYPTELYLYLKIEDLPEGIYHYDAGHHQLVRLREGNYDSFINRAIGNACNIESCFATAFVSIRFWKNFFKYNNFSYRLQGLDAGCLMGQLLETATRFGCQSGVYHQFLDSAVNHLLGLPEKEESVYSIIPLSVEPTRWTTSGGDSSTTPAELIGELEELDAQLYEHSRFVKEFPMLIAMNEASKAGSTQSFQKLPAEKKHRQEKLSVSLPEYEIFSYDFADAAKKRFSPEKDFVLGKISKEQLSILLRESLAAFSHRNDLDGWPGQEPRVSLYASLYNVEGIADGIYFYDREEHALREVAHGDHRLALQSGLVMDNVNLLQTPICLMIAGSNAFYKKELGFRGYRVLHMEAGMLTQQLLLTASALGLGGHALLGFNAKTSDGIFHLEKETSLIQIPIGPYRPRPWLKAALHG